MKFINYIHQLLIIGILLLFLPNQTFATESDSLNISSIPKGKQFQLEINITSNYLIIQDIVPHLIEMQGQIPALQEVFENYNKVEKLWGYYEEAKRDGKNLEHNPLTKELAFSTKYTLYLLNESLDDVLRHLKNEHLRVALVNWKGQKLAESKAIYQKDKAEFKPFRKDEAKRYGQSNH